MSDVNSGTATAAYILDITDVERKATQLRTILAGVRNDAVSPAVSPVAATAAPQQTAGINENAAALSRQALAAGDAAGAVELMNQALGKSTEQEKQSTTATEATVRAQASLRVALGDTIGAIELLEAAHAQSVQGSVEEVAIARQLAQIENQGLAATQRAADAEIRLAQERARAAVAVKDYMGALEILNGVQTEGASAQTVAALETQIATTERAGTVTGAFGGQLSALVNPTTLVIAGLGIATKAVSSFSDALDFVGKLQDSRTAFGGILGDFQKGNTILDEASKRTRAFGITEEATTQAFRDLAPAIRDSTATTDQQAEALARYSVLHPEDPVNALKTAVEGLASGGRISQIAKDLDLTAGEQARLKQSVAEGKDAFVALNDVLDQHGITLDAAAKRMDGLAGATRREQIATEDLKKAQGNFAAGPGIAITNKEVQLLNDTTNLLNGNFRKFATDNGPGFVKTITDVPTVLGPITGTISRYNSAVIDLGGSLLGLNAPSTAASAATSRLKDDFYDAAAADQALFAQSTRVGGAFEDERRAAGQLSQAFADLRTGRELNNQAIAEQQAKQLASTLSAQDAAKAQDLLASLGASVAQGFQTSGNAALVYAQRLNIAYGQALILVNAQAQIAQQATNAQALADQRAGERGGETDAQLKARNAANKLNVTYTNNLRDSEIALAAAKKDTGQQIDLLRQKQAQYAKGTAEFNQIEAQIIGIETSAGKTRVSAAATTGLQLAQTEETSQAAILKAQREGLERLRDSQEDFDLHRARNQQDEDLKIQSLLAHGQRAQADEERKKFALDQQRNQEDFTIQRQRTLRNNAESTGDIDTRTDLRQSQIGQRAALRGVRPTGGGSGVPGTPTFIPDAPTRPTQPITLRIQIAPTSVQIDGENFVTITWPLLEQRIDTELASELSTIGITLPPGGGQQAVAGARP